MASEMEQRHRYGIYNALDRNTVVP